MDDNQEKKTHKKPDDYSDLHFASFSVSLCISQHSCFILFSYLSTSGFILNWSSAIKASPQSSNEVIVFPPCESHCFYCWHRLCKGETLSSQYNKVSMLNHHKKSSASSFIRATLPCTAQLLVTGCCQSSHPTKLNHRWICTFSDWKNCLIIDHCLKQSKKGRRHNIQKDVTF